MRPIGAGVTVRSRHIPRHNPEHGETVRHPLKLGQGRVLVHGDVRPGVRRPPQVGLQHSRPPINRDLFKAYLLLTPVAQDGLPPAARMFCTQLVPPPSIDTR